MLYQLSKMQSDTLVIIMYCDSPSLELSAYNLIYKKYDVAKEYREVVSDIKRLAEVNSASAFSPLLGTKWCITVDMDKIPIKTIGSQASIAYDSCIKIYKTSKYGIYKQLCELNSLKKLGRYMQTAYGGTIYTHDIEYLINEYDVEVSEKIQKLLVDKYKREPQSICDLLSMIRSGYDASDEKAVIEAIGLGDINVSSWVVAVLQINPKSERGRHTKEKHLLQYLDNLADSLDYSVIQKNIISTLDSFIDIKQAIISGNLSTLNDKPPTYYADWRQERFRRALRYRTFLANDVSMEKLLAVRSLYKTYYFQPKMSVLHWLYQIFALSGLSGLMEDNRRQVIDTDVPPEAFFDPICYDNFGRYTIERHLIPKKPRSKTKVTRVENSVETVESDNSDSENGLTSVVSFFRELENSSYDS